jgi:hypothetical protein
MPVQCAGIFLRLENGSFQKLPFSIYRCKDNRSFWKLRLSVNTIVQCFFAFLLNNFQLHVIAKENNYNYRRVVILR